MPAVVGDLRQVDADAARGGAPACIERRIEQQLRVHRHGEPAVFDQFLFELARAPTGAAERDRRGVRALAARHRLEHVARGGDVQAVGESLYVTTSRDILEAMAEGTGPDHAVVALGCAGWGAGQLEQELIEDSWLTVPVNAQLLFDTPLDARWRAAAGSIGVDLSQVADHSGHA